MSSLAKILAALAVIAIIVVVVVYFLDKQDDDSSDSTENTTTQQDQGNDNTGDSAKLAPSTAQYQITFDAVWSKDNGHTVIPDGAHFSPFIAWTHAKDFKMFSSGESASEGIKVMAETGAPQPLLAELEKAKQDGKVGAYVTGELVNSPGTVQRMIEPTQTYRYITVVSMLAPSPDWFVAVTDFEMFASNEWKSGFSNYETAIR